MEVTTKGQKTLQENWPALRYIQVPTPATTMLRIRAVGFKDSGARLKRAMTAR